MGELDVERIIALSKEPPNVLPPGEERTGAPAAARLALALLSVMPGSWEAVQSWVADENSGSKPA